MAILSTLKRKVQTGASRIRSFIGRKVAKTHKTRKAAAAERVTATPAYLDEQDNLSICSDSSSLWNVSHLSYRDVFDLSLESNQDAWTVDTLALDAILRDIDGEEEDPDCPPQLRFRRCCSSPIPKPEVPSTATTSKANSVAEKGPSVSDSALIRRRKRHASSRPTSEIILVQEANEDSRLDLTAKTEEAKTSLPLVRPKHSVRRQSNPMQLAKLPSITDLAAQSKAKPADLPLVRPFRSLRMQGNPKLPAITVCRSLH